MEKWFSEKRLWLFGNRLPLLPRRSRGPAMSMERYEKICKIGEGSYGVVFKCRCRDTGELVAIKKYVDSEDDPVIRKIALREIRMLKSLRHPNLVNLIEVFRRKRRLHLVFEFCERTVLDEVESHPHGAPEEVAQMIAWQTLVGLRYIHSRHCIHRDIKPENLLLTSAGLLKLCDFGFARSVSSPDGDLTEYVATRWYRAPELLCAMPKYGPAVDVWAVGCVFAELLRSAALWPGNTDMDQLYLIQRTLGDLTPEQMQALRISDSPSRRNHGATVIKEPLEKMLPKTLSPQGFDFLTKCFEKNPARRYTCDQLIKLPYFHNFHTSDLDIYTGNYEVPPIFKPKKGNVMIKDRRKCKIIDDRYQLGIKDKAAVASYRKNVPFDGHHLRNGAHDGNIWLKVPTLPQLPANNLHVVSQGLGQPSSPAKRGRSRGEDKDSHLPSL